MIGTKPQAGASASLVLSKAQGQKWLSGWLHIPPGERSCRALIWASGLGIVGMSFFSHLDNETL